MLNVVRLKNHAKMKLYTCEYFRWHTVFFFFSSFSIIIKVEMNKNEFLKLNINVYVYNIIYIIQFEKKKPYIISHISVHARILILLIRIQRTLEEKKKSP